jgi:hypothetical protein
MLSLPLFAIVVPQAAWHIAVSQVASTLRIAAREDICSTHFEDRIQMRNRTVLSASMCLILMFLQNVFANADMSFWTRIIA